MSRAAQEVGLRGTSLSLIFALIFIVHGVFSTPLAHSAELRESFVYPLVGTRVSSNFGKRVHPVLRTKRHHNGIDLAAPNDALIRSIKSGVVIYADPHGGYGNLVVIAHGDGLTSHYGHCKDIKVSIGDKVSTGEIIGTVGSTGMVTGPHLHFEVRKNGKALDPKKLFPDIARKGAG